MNEEQEMDNDLSISQHQHALIAEEIVRKRIYTMDNRMNFELALAYRDFNKAKELLDNGLNINEERSIGHVKSFYLQSYLRWDVVVNFLLENGAIITIDKFKALLNRLSVEAIENDIAARNRRNQKEQKNAKDK